MHLASPRRVPMYVSRVCTSYVRIRCREAMGQMWMHTRGSSVRARRRSCGGFGAGQPQVLVRAGVSVGVYLCALHVATLDRMWQVLQGLQGRQDGPALRERRSVRGAGGAPSQLTHCTHCCMHSTLNAVPARQVQFKECWCRQGSPNAPPPPPPPPLPPSQPSEVCKTEGGAPVPSAAVEYACARPHTISK